MTIIFLDDANSLPLIDILRLWALGWRYVVLILLMTSSSLAYFLSLIVCGLNEKGQKNIMNKKIVLIICELGPSNKLYQVANTHSLSMITW